MRTKSAVLGLTVLASILLSAAPAVFLGGLKGPENLAFDSSGVLYITDTDHLWKYTKEKGLEQLYARDPKNDGTSLCGLALAPDGSIVFSASNRLLKLDVGGKAAEYASGFKLANGMAMDASGNIFVADSNAKQIVLVTPDGKTSVLVKGEGAVNGLRYQPATRRLYFTSMLSGKVGYVELSPELEAGKAVIVADLGVGLDDLALGADGSLYVCQYLKGKVIKIKTTGNQEVIAEGIKGPSSLAFGVLPGDQSKLYILEKGANMKFDGTAVLVMDMK